MDMALWIIQIILSIKLVTVSYTHGLRQSQPTMQEAIQKMGKFSPPLLYYYFSLYLHWGCDIGSSGRFGVIKLGDINNGNHHVHHVVVLNFLPC